MNQSQNPVPPSDLLLRITGDGDQAFNTEIGESAVKLFIELCELKPSEHVLEIGCGVGRIALALTSYLDSKGTYDGFDVVPEAIEWCTANITSRHPNFKFQLADVFNGWYNPGGGVHPRDYRFPYEDEAFDFAFLTSVFTHMVPTDVEHYLSETRRVLKTGGRAMFTLFLLNDESTALIAAGKGVPFFEHDLGGFRVVSRDVPEATVALQEEFVFDLFRRCGMVVRKPIYYGTWPGREGCLVYQDTLVADVT